MELGLYLALGDPVSGGDLLDGVGVPVPPHENQATFQRQAPKKLIQNPADLFAVHLPFVGWVWDALFQLLCQCDADGITLGGGIPLEPPQGEIPADLRQIRIEIVRPLGRDGFPCSHIGITHAFLGILTGMQDLIGDGKQLSAINCVRLPDGIFASFPEQRYNLRIGL